MPDNPDYPLIIIQKRPSGILRMQGERVPLSKQTFDMLRGNPPPTANTNTKFDILGDMKTGGTVQKTGLYRLHKGERVVPAKKRPR